MSVEEKKIIILESNFIIAHHLKHYLNKNGFKVFNDIQPLNFRFEIPVYFKPDFVIVNHKMAIKKHQVINEKIKSFGETTIVILFCLEPKPIINQVYRNFKIICIEKPFVGYELINELVA